MTAHQITTLLYRQAQGASKPSDALANEIIPIWAQTLRRNNAIILAQRRRSLANPRILQPTSHCPSGRYQEWRLP